MMKWLAPMALLLWLIAASCKDAQHLVPETRIAKTVPPTYIKNTDTLFTKHQDTLYRGADFFTGYRYELNDLGDTVELGSYFNGMEEGRQRKWYATGRLEQERFFVNGKKEGLQCGWWPDGKPQFAYTTYNDEYDGELKEWSKKGLLYKFFHYKNGQEEGSQRMWWEDGTVRANYVIRDGKKYGLLGMKICMNPYDSINKK